MKRPRDHDRHHDPKRRAAHSGQAVFDPATMRLVPQRTCVIAPAPDPEIVLCDECRDPIDPTSSWLCSRCNKLVCRGCCVPRDAVICLDCI